MTYASHPLTVALAWLLLCLTQTCEAPAHADAWTSQEIAIARICVNESSFSRLDCAAIAYARETYDADELRRMHPRALDPDRSDRRRWIAGLDASMREPAGWPADLVSWEMRGRPAWVATLALVRDVIARRVAPPCSERPQVWGGRRVDEDRVRRILDAGGREVCTGTRNAFLRLGGDR